MQNNTKTQRKVWPADQGPRFLPSSRDFQAFPIWIEQKYININSI